MSAADAKRTESQRGQALIVALGAVFVLMLGASVLFLFGSALAGKGRAQRAADLAALSAARSMRDDLDRLFEPPTIDGRPNPYHLTAAEYLARARDAAVSIGRANGAHLQSADVTFPGGEELAPSRVKVAVRDEVAVRDDSVAVAAVAVAEVVAPLGEGAPLEASGAGYSGPLSYRQGKPMRPDVARAFDRMNAAARADGIHLIVTSGYRSDAEQAELYKRHPDPKWVAPPGKSLHRFGTELDLGPPSAYGWLARNARRFHFIQRYEWEPWHYELPLAPYAGTHNGTRPLGSQPSRPAPLSNANGRSPQVEAPSDSEPRQRGADSGTPHFRANSGNLASRCLTRWVPRDIFHAQLEARSSGEEALGGREVEVRAQRRRGEIQHGRICIEGADCRCDRLGAGAGAQRVQSLHLS